MRLLLFLGFAHSPIFHSKLLSALRLAIFMPLGLGIEVSKLGHSMPIGWAIA